MYFYINSIARRKKTRFAVVRGYRSKLRLWTFQRRQLTTIIIYYLSFNPPPTEKQDHCFKRKALGDVVAGRRARTSTLCPVFFFFIFRNVWHQNDITSHHSKYFLREPFPLWPLLVIRILLKVKALLWLWPTMITVDESVSARPIYGYIKLAE